eukprot:396453_1
MGTSNSIEELQSDTVKSGYLLKESKHLRTYRKRFIVLKGTTLISYKTEQQSSNEITELIDLHEYNFLEESSAIIFFIASDDDEERAFRAESKKDMQEWVTCIRKVFHDNHNYTIQNSR